jgi:hypothetical protein
MAISEDRLREILRDALPSCGVARALELPDDATVEVVVDLTVAEWRELSRNIVEEHEA